MSRKKALFPWASILLLFSAFLAQFALSTSPTVYDPWIDTNDDGRIDIVDLTNLAVQFGSEGAPINKTALQGLEQEYYKYVSAYESLRIKVNQRIWIQNMSTIFVTPEDPSVRERVDEITGVWGNDSWGAMKAMYTWTRNNMQYRDDTLYPMLPPDPSDPVTFFPDVWQFPNETLRLKKGDCEDQAALLCSMIRCYGQMQYWIECIWIANASSSHVAIQIPCVGNTLVIFDPVGNYYSRDFSGNIAFNKVDVEIKNWLNYWKPKFGNEVYVFRIFSDYIDKTFTSTDEYIAWMYSQR